MAIPAQSDFYRPILEITSGTTDSLSRKDLIQELLNIFPMTIEELQDMIPSGGETRVVTRINWAIYELKSAGLLHYPRSSQVQITESGRNFLGSQTEKITYTQLKRLSQGALDEPDFSAAIDVGNNEINPEEQIAKSYQEQQDRLAEEILENLATMTPQNFERIVNRLLYRIGYGDIVREFGNSGDLGFDGILNQDALGLEKVYVQAKRYNSCVVGEPEIRNFSGSLDRPGATKGIFVSTSTFSYSARESAEDISKGNKTIRLIDGKELAQLMIEYGVGVITETTYEVKKLDANYFADL